MWHSTKLFCWRNVTLCQWESTVLCLSVHRGRISLSHDAMAWDTPSSRKDRVPYPQPVYSLTLTRSTKHACEGSTLTLKPRGDVIRSPKQGYQWPHKKDSCPPNNLLKKQKNTRPVTNGEWLLLVAERLSKVLALIDEPNLCGKLFRKVWKIKKRFE